MIRTQVLTSRQAPTRILQTSPITPGRALLQVAMSRRGPNYECGPQRSRKRKHSPAHRDNSSRYTAAYAETLRRDAVARFIYTRNRRCASRPNRIELLAGCPAPVPVIVMFRNISFGASAPTSSAEVQSCGHRRLDYEEEVYLVTALVPSDTACLASSPGRTRRTAVCGERPVRRR